MPEESRVITFSLEELNCAIYNLAQQTNRIRLHGDIQRIELEDEGEVSARLIFDQDKETTLGTSELAAVLIHHCIRNNVQLPANAEKQIRVRGGKIELSMSFRAPSETLSFGHAAE